MFFQCKTPWVSYSPSLGQPASSWQNSSVPLDLRSGYGGYLSTRSTMDELEVIVCDFHQKHKAVAKKGSAEKFKFDLFRL